MNLSSAPVKADKEIASAEPHQALSRVGECLYRSNVSGIIYAIVTQDGRQIRRSLKTRNKDTARVRLVKLRDDLLEAYTQRHDTEIAALSFKDAAGRWLEAVSATLRPRTLESRRWSIKALVPHFPQAIGKITLADADKWSAARSKETAPASYNKEVGVLRSVLAYAVERGALTRNPTAHLKCRKVGKPHIAVPSREQFKSLLVELRRDYRARGAGDLVELMAASGCRLGEAVALRWRDVDWQRGTLTIGANGQTKNGEHRIIPLFPPLRAFLESLRAHNPDATPDAMLLPIQNSKTAIAAACRRLGLPVFSHHKFRHLFCTTALESGVPPHVIAAWAGHKDGGQLVCRTYGHVRAEASELFAARVSWDAPANVVALPVAVNQ